MSIITDVIVGVVNAIGEAVFQTIEGITKIINFIAEAVRIVKELWTDLDAAWTGTQDWIQQKLEQIKEIPGLIANAWSDLIALFAEEKEGIFNWIYEQWDQLIQKIVT